MKNKALMGLIATATIGTAIVTPAMINSPNTTNIVNKVLMVNNSSTNEAVVINGNSSMNLYALSTGLGIVSNLSTGEMLTILGQAQNGYCKVKVQKKGAVGYISVANMQNILNGSNDSFTQLSGNGQVVNVSSNVRLRNNPSIGNNIIGHLTNGTSLTIFGKQGQWYKVSVNGQVGFIYEEYVNTSTVNSNSQSNTTKNILQSKITNKTKISSSSQVNNNSNIGAVSKSSKSSANNKVEQYTPRADAHVNSIGNESKKLSSDNSNMKISKYKQELIYNDKQLTLYKSKLKQEEQNLKVIPEKAVQEEKQKINSLNETLKSIQNGINKTKQSINQFKNNINKYKMALTHDNNVFSNEQMKLIQAENGLKTTYERAKENQLKK